jgi:hypothetical protein
MPAADPRTANGRIWDVEPRRTSTASHRYVVASNSGMLTHVTSSRDLQAKLRRSG